MRVTGQETRYGHLETYPYQPKSCVFLKQLHGDRFVDVTNTSFKFDRTTSYEADGFFCESPSSPNLNFALQTADCIPALVEGNRGWAFMHLGWRGLAQKMSQQEKIQKLDITHLWIGPHISLRNYQVSKDFTQNFPKSDCFDRIGDKLYFNMQKELISQVQSLAPQVLIHASTLCTFQHRQLHSFRASGTKQRNWTIFKNRI